MDGRVAGLLTIAVLVTAPAIPRRCLLFQKLCVSHCPRHMHPYHTRCDRDSISQRTCHSPDMYSIGYSCGWSRCDCNTPMLYDEIQGFCVSEQECIIYMKGKMKNKRRRPKHRISKKLRLDDDDEMMYKKFQVD